MNDLLVLSGEPLVGGPRFPEAHHLTAAPQPDRLLEDLNPSQREAVMATSGPLAIIAGAGSGKTRVISRRAAYAIETGAAASDQILLVTFTEKAAGEMVERMGALGHRGVLARTFPAAGRRSPSSGTSGRAATMARRCRPSWIPSCGSSCR